MIDLLVGFHGTWRRHHILHWKISAVIEEMIGHPNALAFHQNLEQFADRVGSDCRASSQWKS